MRVAFSLAPLEGGAQVYAGRPATATFTLTDARTGEPLQGQRPFAWMTPREGEAPKDEKACNALAREFLGGLLTRAAEVNMNAYLVVTLNHDNTLSVINPQLAFNRTKLLTLISLAGTPADWVLHPSQDELFLTLPGAGRVAMVDTVRFRSRGSVQVGKQPTRIALSPEGRTLVTGNDGDGTVSVLDAHSHEVRQTVQVGPGHHELAFAEGGRTLWVTSSGGEEVHVVDVEAASVVARIPLEKGASSVAASEKAQAVYVASPQRGELVVLDVKTRKVARRLSLEKGVDRVVVGPDGRWLFALNRTQGTATILDGASGQVRHVEKGLKLPDSVSFTERMAYVRGAGQHHVVLVELESLAASGEVVTLDVPITQQPATEGHGVGIAAPIVALPEGGGVLVAGPADKALYFYKEGLMAPSGTHRNYGREPRAVLVVDRSLKEVRPGVYSATVRPGEDGIYDVPVLLDSPRMALCFEHTVGSGKATARKGPPVELTPLFDPKQLLTAESETELRFRVVDAATKLPVPADKVQVLLIRPPGTWHTRAVPRALEDGTLAVSFTPPTPGQYQLLVGTHAPPSRIGQLPPILLGATKQAHRALPRDTLEKTRKEPGVKEVMP
ncbi:MAG: YncE family protein [Myxococcaceae bacterium]|nr:YncE family protein [Myxococcaceae bacterium]MCI0671847.1 YncE family protein [Myxococcaceae bacterium]